MTQIRLSRLLTLEEAVQVSDGAGGFTESWQALGNIWAEVRAGAGRELGAEEITLSSVPLRITVRGAVHGTGRRPRPGQRFREKQRLFRILAVAERADMYLTCFAREEVPA